ncbi:MAG: methyl-accepting chemotaxis protein [Candidatus Latescibacterota bacterium]|nr:MAG: methyl-accepting chemotaxis protein [Candidatus Latescibacterota bacterium]
MGLFTTGFNYELPARFVAEKDAVYSGSKLACYPTAQSRASDTPNDENDSHKGRRRAGPREEHMKVPNFPRRRYLIDNLQYRLLSVSLFYFATVVLVFAGTLFIPIIIEMNSGSLASPVVQEAAHEFLAFHTRLWPPALLLFGLLALHTIVLSHRIVGPLYRIRSELKKIGDGNLFVHVRLRKNDYLTKDSEAINQMVEALRTKIRKIETSQKNAHNVLVELQRAVIRGSADGVNDKIEELSDVIHDLKKNVEQFQIPRTTTRVPEKSADKKSEKPVEAAPVEVGTKVGV